jgi:phosphoglycerate-specific signal transduction histidine kinase
MKEALESKEDEIYISPINLNREFKQIEFPMKPTIRIAKIIKIEEFATRLEVEVDNKTKELKELNRSLQRKIDEKLVEIRKKDQAMLQQNKMVAMGEMIGAIAHQWRQPLNSLGINIQSLIDMVEDDGCDMENIEKFIDKNMDTIQFMNRTIDDFRNFFREDKEKQIFDVKDAINSTISLQSEQLKHIISLLN